MGYRGVAKLAHKSTKDQKAKRINVPAWFVEIYYLVVFAVEFLLYLTHSGGQNVGLYISIYFIFESFVWIVYYSIFRRFFEESYKTQHSLEYFILFPAVLMTQVVAFACIYGQTIQNTLMYFLCVDNAEHSIIIVLGFIYQALVIGMIISSFPEERTKAGIKRTKHIIVGNGDVVKRRLIPALNMQNEYIQRKYDIKAISSNDKNSENVWVKDDSKTIAEEIRKISTGRSIIWIETPSNEHVSYLRFLVKGMDLTNKLIVMEKPISVDTQELAEVKTINADKKIRGHIFYLSYYLLEKALPLYYLYSRREEYKKYLSCSNLEMFDNGLGRLKRIEVIISEKEETRESVLNSQLIQKCDTLIHNVLIASLFAGLPQNWTISEASVDRNGKYLILAKSGETEIKLVQEKNKDVQVRRTASLKYEFGNVEMNIDSGTLTIVKDGYGISTIKLKPEYSQQYSIQTDMVIRAYNEEILCEESDGLYNQIECMEWLINEKFITK